MSISFDLHARSVVCKSPDGRKQRTLLEIDALDIAQGSHVAIQGASGAGKTTLLKVLSGIVKVEGSQVRWGETDLSGLSEAQRDAWRGRCCGFLFQDFGLMEGLTAFENVVLPETFRGAVSRQAKARARDLLNRFEVPADTLASSLSRGEMQRTALARLLMGRPRVIFADEPTASLDAANAHRVMQALAQSAQALDATLLVITHDAAAAERFPARGLMRQGKWQWIVPIDAKASS